MRHLIFMVVVGGVLAIFANPAWSVPTFYIVQRDARFTQTGPTTTAVDGFGLIGRATPNDGIGPINFDGGSLALPAASPLGTVPLGPVGVELQYSSGVVNQTTFQTNYPNGIYTFHLTDSANGAHTETEAVDSTLATAPTTTPILSAASFTGLQGMNPAQPFTVNFNQFTSAGPVSLSFFAIVDSNNSTVLFDSLQPNVVQDTIPANTLQLGKSYAYVLFFANFAITPDNNAEVLLDNRTKGFFATVPEPSSALICLLGVATMFAFRQRLLGKRRA